MVSGWWPIVQQRMVSGAIFLKLTIFTNPTGNELEFMFKGFSLFFTKINVPVVSIVVLGLEVPSSKTLHGNGSISLKKWAISYCQMDILFPNPPTK